MPTVPLARRNSLFGKWSGHMEQKVGAECVLASHSMNLEFIKGSTATSGSMKLEYLSANETELDEKPIQAEVINIIYDGRILKCDYVNKDDNVIHFGTIYGELSANGRQIKGEFIGYGLISEQLVAGSIILERKLA